MAESLFQCKYKLYITFYKQGCGSNVNVVIGSLNE